MTAPPPPPTAAPPPAPPPPDAGMRPPTTLTKSVSLRRRVTAMAATVVAVAVLLLAAAAYLVVQDALYDDVDTQLRGRADTLLSSSQSLQFQDVRSAENVLALTSLFSNDLRVALVTRTSRASIADQEPPIAEPELAVIRGAESRSLRTAGSFRVYAERADNGITLVLAQSLDPTREVLRRLATVLLLVGGAGILAALGTGAAVGRAGLRPVARLTAAAERVARTDQLTPIPVTGDDELARLTTSFNAMLRSLGESRQRQQQLVADAGHELRTPLTSLRTNMELLAAANRPGAATLSETDRTELHADVTAQVEELSTLVGDLVDLAREDAPQVLEPVALVDVVDRALERARRRRGEVEFVAELSAWTVQGESASLERAVLNVLDNAAKWSPAGQTVVVRLGQVDPGHAELTVADAGPGIPDEDVGQVFERFYRSTAARSMPGSGLGLAIVKQVVVRHGGAVRAERSNRGGALIRLRLPGDPGSVEDHG